MPITEVQSISTLSFAQAHLGDRFRHPMVSQDEEGKQVFEWVFGERRLAIFFPGNDYPTFIKSVGPNIHTDMEDGMIDGEETLEDCLDWIFPAEK